MRRTRGRLEPNLSATPTRTDVNTDVQFTSHSKIIRGGSPISSGFPSPRRDAEPDIVAWDFEGDGVPNQPPGVLESSESVELDAEQTASFKYQNAGLFNAAIMVVEGDIRGTDHETITVLGPVGPPPLGEPDSPGNPRPTAVIAGPSSATPNHQVAFDAKHSSDDGRRSAHQLEVRYREPDLRATAAQRAPARPFAAVLTGLAGSSIPAAHRRGALIKRRGIAGRGRMRARLTGRRRRGDALVKGLLNGTWRTLLASSFDTRTLSGRLTGTALVRPRGRGGRACLSFRLTVPSFGRPTGTLQLRGGTGRYARLRLSARFTVTEQGRASRMAGSARVRRAGARGFRGSCSTQRR